MASDEDAGSNFEGPGWGDARFRAADILGYSPRTLRRWRERYEKEGYDGLLHRRRGTPSPKRVAVAELTRV